MKFKLRRFMSAAADGGTGAAGAESINNPAAKEPDAGGGANPVPKESGTDGEANPVPKSPVDGEADPPDKPEAVSMDDIKKQVSDTFAEELKKSKMSEVELKEFELEQKQKQLDTKEKEIAAWEHKVNAKKLLTKMGLSPDVADAVLGKDMEATKRNIDIFKACLDGEVQRQVAERMKGKTPASGSEGTASAVEEEFKRIKRRKLNRRRK